MRCAYRITLSTCFGLYFAAGISLTDAQEKKSGRAPIPIYVTPFYDSDGTKVEIGAFSEKLAKADAKSILDVTAELKKQKEKLRAEVMFVAAVRLYDLGHKDDAVYWFHTAKYRARIFVDTLDKEK